MKRYLPLALLAAFALTACTGKDDTATDAAPSTENTAASDAELLKQAEQANQNPGAVAEPGATPAADPATPAATPTESAGPVPGLKVGEDYELVQNGQPFEPLNGKIEVVEMFGYVCPACAAFQPTVVGWKKTLPADVRFTYVPAAFGGGWDKFARAFYAAQALGLVDKTHEKVYDAIHLDGVLKGERGDDSEQDIAKFYGQFGVDPKVFVGNMSSFAVTGKFNRAKQYFAAQSIGATPSTPTIYVNGKYRVLGRNPQERFRIVDALIAHERAQGGAAAAAAPAAKPAG